MSTENSNTLAEYDEVTTNEKDLPSFGLEILRVIKDSHSQHGLRHGDFQRYHGYCSRRLRRLRKVVGFKMGDKKRVIPKKITEALLTDPRYILILVMTTERAWSYAMQLKHTGKDEPRKRHHMIKRLKKASNHAMELNRLCHTSPRVDEHTKLESQAYCSYINGLLKFEIKEWKVAMDRFTQTQTIYEKMCEVMSTEDCVPYKQMIEEVSPNIRYCAYNIGDQSAINDLMHLRASARQDVLLMDKLDSLIIQTKAKKAATMGEVAWKNQTIPVKNEKVRVFFIGLKEFNEEISSADKEAKIDMYESILSECKDALQYVKEDLKSEQGNKVGDSIDNSNLIHLQSYLTYIRVEKSVKRNLLLIENLKNGCGIADLFVSTGDSKTNTKAVKPSDFIRVYDIILQNLLEMKSISGLSNDKSEQVWVDGQITAFKAIKCFFIGQAYVNLSKWQEGMALYERVLEHAKKAIQVMQSKQLKSRDNFVDLNDLEELIEVIAFNKYRVHASAIMQTSEQSLKEEENDKNKLAKQFQNVSLLDRLNDYYEDINLSESSLLTKSRMTSAYPPSFQAVPCKPLFFDLALNHLSFPPLDDKMAPKPGQKSGISGYFKGWLGWGAKK